MLDPTAIPMTAPPAVYRQRRARLAAALTRPLVIFAGHAQARNYAANVYVFRAGSTYRYFGGPPLENAALLLEPGSDGDQGCTLVRPTPEPDDLIWSGEPADDRAIAAAAGLSHDGLAATEELQWLVAGHDAAAIVPPCVDTQALAARLGLATASANEQLAIIGLRLIKDEHELAAMRRAAAVNVAALRAAAAAIAPGRGEADVAAAFHAVVAAGQCRPSFTPIVTIRGEILHGVGHPNALPAGGMLLIDAGAEEPGGYACDITRTFPISGQWTAVQRHIYETVWRAMDAAVVASVPGKRFRDVHDLAARVICEGLVQAELLRGNPADLAARAAHSLFFVHGIGHLIGLDVHDMEDFGDLAGYASGRSRRPEFGNKFLRLDRDLEPGYCVTIEPGIYLVPGLWQRDDLVGPLADVVNRPKVDALLRDRFGGIRIEHTIAVRATGGPEVLSGELPSKADDVAAMVGTR